METKIPQTLPGVSVNSFGKLGATYSFTLPKSAKGVSPSLELNYNQLSGNGMFGMGWSISGIDSVTRNFGEGIHLDLIPNYFSTMVGDLVNIGGNAYHPEKEKFIRFYAEGEGSCGMGACSFTAQDTTGKKYYFGSNSGVNSKVHSTLDPSSVVMYYLDKVEDVFGNQYVIEYNSWSQSENYGYPSKIMYNRDSSGSGYNTIINFHYIERQDKNYNYQLLTESRMAYLIDSIVVEQFDGSSFEEVENYKFYYEMGELQRSRLKTIERKGYEDITFSYIDNQIVAEEVKKNQQDFSDLNFTAYMEKRDDCTTMELWCACALNTGCFATIPLSKDICASFIDSYYQVCYVGIEYNQSFFADIDRDNSLDFVRVNGAQNNNYLTATKITENGFGTSAKSSFTFQLTEKSILLQGDYNADLRVDFAILETDNAPLKVAYATGDFSNPFRLVTYSNILISNLNTDNEDIQGRHFSIDVNNDSLTDLIFYDGVNFNAYISSGNGFNLTKVYNINDYGNTFQQFIDMDENGVPDFVRIAGDAVYITFFDENLKVIDETNSIVSDIGTDGNRFLADTNGDNFKDFIVYSEADGKKLKVFLFNGEGFEEASISDMNHTRLYVNSEGKIETGVKGYDLVDVNFDGLEDKVTLNNESSYKIELNNGSGGYSTSVVLTFSGIWYNMYPDSHFCNDYLWVENGDIKIKIAYWKVDDKGTPDPKDDVVYGCSLDGVGITTIDVDDSSFNAPVENQTSEEEIMDVTNRIYLNWMQAPKFGDINGDKKADFIRIGYDKKMYISFSKTDSNGKVYYSSEYDLKYDQDYSIIQTYDMNNDGRMDIVGFHANSELVVYADTAHPVWTTWGLYYLTYYNYSAHHGEGNVFVHYLKDATEPSDVLKEIKGSYGEKITFDYANTKSIPGIINYSFFDPSFPNIHPFIFSDFIVKDYTNVTGSGTNLTISNEFQNSKFQLGNEDERAMLGFEKIRNMENIQGTYSDYYYEQNKEGDYAGLVKTQYTYYSTGNLKNSSSNSYQKYYSPWGTTFIELLTESTDSYYLGQKVSQTKNTKTFSSYGLIDFERVEKFDGSGNLKSTIDSDNTYNTSPSVNWAQGRIVSSQKFVDSNLVSEQSFTYSGELLKYSKVLIDDNIYATTEFSNYDRFGNPTKIKNPEGHVSEIVFDEVTGCYPVTITNPLGQETKTTYSYEFGLPLTNTDVNNVVSTKSYDRYGRIIEVSYPGETKWSERYEYYNTGSPLGTQDSPFSGEYTVKYLRDESNSSEIWSIQAVDYAGNAIYNETKGKNGDSIKKLSYYYSDGRIQKSSNPFHSGDPIYYTDYFYDSEFNLVYYISPDNKKFETQYSFSNTGILTTKIISNFGNSTWNAVFTESELTNYLGQKIEKIVQGKKIKYEYDVAGNLTKVTDPLNGTIEMGYLFNGKKEYNIDPNTGRLDFTYDSLGHVLTKTDSRGLTTFYEYDELGRVVKNYTSDVSDTEIEYFYDESGSNSLGRLTSVMDGSGYSKFWYDAKGNIIKASKEVDNYQFVVVKEFDNLNRQQTFVFPEGTKLHYYYTDYGSPLKITMDSKDGSSLGHTLIEYEDLDEENKLKKKFGNGVVEEFFYDSISKRPTGTEMVLANEVDPVKLLSYEYDGLGNINKIKDEIYSDRTESYTYDTLNRLVSAQGKFGSYSYAYDDDGKMTKNADVNLYYEDKSHKNAVSRTYSEKLGERKFAYDAIGNMTQKNGDQIIYDGFGKMIHYLPTGTGFGYLYSNDFTGMKFKEIDEQSGQITYYMSNIFEMRVVPGEETEQAIYIRGLSGDLIAQDSRNGDGLITENYKLSFNQDSKIKTESNLTYASLVGSFCDEITIDCGLYYKNRVVFLSKNFVQSILFLDSGFRISNSTRILALTVALLLLFGFFWHFTKNNQKELQQEHGKNITLFCKNKKTTIKFKKYHLKEKSVTFSPRRPIFAVTPMLLLAIILNFNVANCGVIFGGKPKGIEPWKMGVSYFYMNHKKTGGPTSSSDDDDPLIFGNESESKEMGFYFIHLNHLGGTSMITDGYGDLVTGGEFGGASNIEYEPYGLIDGDNSSGPLYTSFTYTGQRRDRSTGLLDYNFRAYDPELGRFLSPDDRNFPNHPNGMDPYMYVTGNPINFQDSTGHGNELIHMFNQIVMHMLGGKSNANKARKDFIKFVFEEYKPDDVLDGLMVVGFAAHLGREYKHKMKLKRERMLGITIVAGAVGVALIVGSCGLATFEVGVLWGVVLTGAYIGGCTLTGFAIGSTAGYFAAGKLNYYKGNVKMNERWNEDAAQAGWMAGGITGAAIGFQVGMMTAPSMLAFNSATHTTIFGSNHVLSYSLSSNGEMVLKVATPGVMHGFKMGMGVFTAYQYAKDGNYVMALGSFWMELYSIGFGYPMPNPSYVDLAQVPEKTYLSNLKEGVYE